MATDIFLQGRKKVPFRKIKPGGWCEDGKYGLCRRFDAENLADAPQDGAWPSNAMAMSDGRPVFILWGAQVRPIEKIEISEKPEEDDEC